MKKTPIALAAVAAACLAIPLASAGVRTYTGLYVSPSNGYSRYMYGAFGDTRNSANPNEYAECGSNETTGYCTFVDGNGVYSYCWTTDPARLAVIRSMSGDASISVSWLEASAECTYVLSYASSRAQPKAH